MSLQALRFDGRAACAARRMFMAGDAPRGDGAPPAPPTSITDTTGVAAGAHAAAHGGHGGHTAAKTGFLGLTVGAIGVVFGDIGTSPLYALREAIAHAQS